MSEPSEPRVLDICMQEPHMRGDVVQPLIVRVTSRLPVDDMPGEPVLWQTFYHAEAVKLADALWDTLPGGTVDQLVVELLSRRTSLFRVGFMTVQELADLATIRARQGEVTP